MLWKALETLRAWERENLPGDNINQSTELLTWLLKNGDAPRSLKCLYSSSQYSEPTVRACLRAFKDKGLVTVEVADGDTRNRYIRCTSRFDQIVSGYSSILQRAMVASGANDSSDNRYLESEIGEADKPESSC